MSPRATYRGPGLQCGCPGGGTFKSRAQWEVSGHRAPPPEGSMPPHQWVSSGGEATALLPLAISLLLSLIVRQITGPAPGLQPCTVRTHRQITVNQENLFFLYMAKPQMFCYSNTKWTETHWLTNSGVGQTSSAGRLFTRLFQRLCSSLDLRPTCGLLGG